MTYSWKMPLAAASRVTGEGEEWEPQVKQPPGCYSVQARNVGGLWAEGHRSGDEWSYLGLTE